MKTPRLRNVMDIKGPLRAGTLIHFSAEQWKQATAKIPKGKASPQHGIGFGYYPLPDGGVIVQPRCIQGPCEICRDPSMGFGGRGEMIFRCHCEPDRVRCPDLEEPLSPLCELFIGRINGQIVIGCRNNGCANLCRMTRVRRDGQTMIVCRCVT